MFSRGLGVVLEGRNAALADRGSILIGLVPDDKPNCEAADRREHYENENCIEHQHHSLIVQTK